jgi:hypothetical protein
MPAGTLLGERELMVTDPVGAGVGSGCGCIGGTTEAPPPQPEAAKTMATKQKITPIVRSIPAVAFFLSSFEPNSGSSRSRGNE